MKKVIYSKALGCMYLAGCLIFVWVIALFSMYGLAVLILK
jgi:hypothetical protein